MVENLETESKDCQKIDTTMPLAPDENVEIKVRMFTANKPSIKSGSLNLQNELPQEKQNFEIEVEKKTFDMNQNISRTDILADNRIKNKSPYLEESSVSIESSEKKLRNPRGRFLKKIAKTSQKEDPHTSESASKATQTSFSALQKSLQEKNSFEMLKGYYMLGILATLVIVVVSILGFVITNSALEVLAELANVNLHPTQVATYINYSRKEALETAAIDRGLIHQSMGSLSSTLLSFYFSGYEGEFAFILNTTTPLHILEDHFNQNLIQLFIPISNQNETDSLITAVGMLEAENLQLSTDVSNNINISGDSYFPRVFFEVNVNNIQNNLFLLLTSITKGIIQQNSLMTSLNLASLLIGGFIIFAVLVFLILLYKNITKKKYEFLVAFCKISKKDLQHEATRLHGQPKIPRNKTNGLFKTGAKKEFASERLFNHYVIPPLPYLFLIAIFFMFFGILILPLLVCYLKLSLYSNHWEEGIRQYNTWEIMRTNLIGFFSDANYVYFNSLTKDATFDGSIATFEDRSETLQQYISDFNGIMSQFGALNNQDLYQGNLSDALEASIKGSFCSYLQEAQTTVDECNGYLGGIAQEGLSSSIDLLYSLQNDYISRLNDSSNLPSTMSTITSETSYSDADNLLLYLNRMLRLFAVDLHDNLLSYLSMMQTFLILILGISITVYLVIMLIGWTILVRRFSHNLNETKNILTILPERILRNNAFIRNFLIREIKVNL